VRVRACVYVCGSLCRFSYTGYKRKHENVHMHARTLESVWVSVHLRVYLRTCKRERACVRRHTEEE